MNNNNDREYPVKYEDLVVGEVYYMEEKRYGNNSDNNDHLNEHVTLLELSSSPSGVKRVTVLFENGNKATFAAANYNFFPRPRHWESTYKSAARNASKLGFAKRNWRNKGYGVAAAKKLPLPNELKQKIGAYLSGVNAPLSEQKQLLKMQVEEVKGPEPGMKGGKRSRRRHRKTRRRNTRRNK